MLPFNSAVPGLNTAEVYRNFIPVKLIEKKEKQLRKEAYLNKQLEEKKSKIQQQKELIHQIVL